MSMLRLSPQSLLLQPLKALRYEAVVGAEREERRVHPGCDAIG
jgi:hypothetical protein